MSVRWLFLLAFVVLSAALEQQSTIIEGSCKGGLVETRVEELNVEVKEVKKRAEEEVTKDTVELVVIKEEEKNEEEKKDTETTTNQLATRVLPPVSSCGAEQYLSPDHIVEGFHVVCLSSEEKFLNLEIYLDGHLYNTRMEKRIIASWETLRKELEESLLLEQLSGSNPSNKYPWQMYTSDGVLIQSLEKALVAKLVFVFKGGSFVWPGISIGHVTVVPNLSGIGNITMTTVSLLPLVFEMKNFLKPEECAHIRTVSEPNLRPSPVSKMDHDQDKPNTHWRTSHNWFMPSAEDPIMLQIDQRVADLTKISKQNQESMQVLRYELGQRYSAHHDYFPPEHYQSDSNKHIMNMIDNGRKNRIITVFCYLSDVESGGETIFPRAGGKPEVNDFNNCEEGLKVKPQTGKVIMFYSMKPNGQFDPYSLHGACPVIEGIKWSANKWIWTGIQNF